VRIQNLTKVGFNIEGIPSSTGVSISRLFVMEVLS
jgi:hypothetical protein